MFCTRCGAQIGDAQRFCPNCGNPVGASAGGGPTPPPFGGFPPPPPPGPSTPVAFVPPTGARAQTGAWVGQGWDLVKADMGMLAVATLVFLVVNAVIPLVLQGPLTAGFYLIFVKKLRDQRSELGDLFQGFNWFVPTLVAAILISVFVMIGSLLCIIPGIVLGAMYMFTYLFIMDKRMDFWPAMQASHAIVKQDYFGFTIFFFVLGLIMMLGVLACLVGVLITLPIMFAAITVAYRDLVGFEPQPA